MDLLLDTHFVLWFAEGNKKFPKSLLALIDDTENNIFVSDVSVLEITIKHAKNPKAMPYSGEDFARMCEEAEFQLRPLTRNSILMYGTLDFAAIDGIHKDPFDRLLIAQSKAEEMCLATHDRLLLLYNEPSVRLFV